MGLKGQFLTLQQAIDLLKEGSAKAMIALESNDGQRLIDFQLWQRKYTEELMFLGAAFGKLDITRLDWNITMLRLQQRVMKQARMESCDHDCANCVYRNDCDDYDGGGDDGDDDDRPAPDGTLLTYEEIVSQLQEG